MNYISLKMLSIASQIMAAIKRYKEEHPEVPAGLTCGWQPDPQFPPCNRPAEYYSPDATRVSAGGDIEVGPQWYCREHLEHDLGAPARNQTLFRRIEGLAEEG